MDEQADAQREPVDSGPDGSGPDGSGRGSSPAEGAASAPAPAWRRGLGHLRAFFDFVDDGCRTEIRLGTLLALMAVFLWLWLGPATSSMLYLAGLPLLAVGVPLQALEGRRRGRPGYPWKLAIVFTVGGVLMIPGLLYRNGVDGPLHVQPIAPMLIVVGLWMLAWWPVSRRARAGSARTAEAA